MGNKLKEKQEIEVIITPTVLKDDTVAPSFNLELIEELYKNSIEFDFEVIEEILNSDRELLIEDLNKVLKDSIDRYKYFSTKAKEEGHNDKELSFLTHAIFLLGELKASESLENVFEILSQDTDFLDFYLGDMLPAYLYVALYKIANNNLEECLPFMKNFEVETYHKSTLVGAILQIVLHQPERHQEVAEWYKELLQYFINSKKSDHVIDSSLMGLLVGHVIDLKISELLPEIEFFYEKDIIDTIIIGPLEKVKIDIKKPINERHKRKIGNIYDIYEQINIWGNKNNIYSEMDPSEWEDNIESESNYDFDLDTTPILRANTKPIVNSKKTGRNDPCPCGSGKKYKKCCLKK